MALTFTSKISKEEFISKLFESRDVAHLMHLKTTSYAQHIALNSYYDDVLDLIDGLIESYQGKYGILTLSIESTKALDPIKYFEELTKYIENNKDKVFNDSWILNQVDTILELMYSTLYKLKNLK